MLFVPPTPGGMLAKELRNREEEINHHCKERIKIVEKSGENLENILCKKNPFKIENCTEKFCPICKNQNGKLKMACNTNNVGYRWVCNTCKEIDEVRLYEGETSRSGRLRGIEHVQSFNKKRADSVLFKHKILEHNNENVDFEMKITGVFKDALTRQADEAVRIHSRKNNELLNSKSEFNHPPVARVIIEKSKKYSSKKVSPGV